MAIFTIPFDFELNVSIQPTDILYMSPVSSDQGGTNHPFNTSSTAPVAIGIVTNVDHNAKTITVNTAGFLVGNPPAELELIDLSNSDYLFFSKDRRVNTSGIVGYYAETEYRNYTKRQAEIFATAVDFVESSK